jgi:tRNA pseudouridine55 synthase
VPAHVSALRRTQSGPFDLTEAVTLEELEALLEADGVAALDARLQSEEVAVASLPRVELTESAGFYLSKGQPVLVPNGPRSGIVRVAVRGGRFLGLGEMLDDGRVAPRRLVAS